MTVNAERHRLAGDYLNRARVDYDEAKQALGERQDKLEHNARLAVAYGWTVEEIASELGITEADARHLTRDREAV